LGGGERVLFVALKALEPYLRENPKVKVCVYHGEDVSGDIILSRA